jgi:endonuclease/exonuclease/phosphatase family metal-dependent hydrolase
VKEEKPKKRISLLSGLILLLNVFFIVLLLAVYLSVYISPERIPLLAFAGLAYPVILLINIFFIVIWIFIRIKYTLLSLVFILLGWNHIGRLIQFNKNQETGKSDKSFKILSYNIQNFVKMNVSNTKYITDFGIQSKITKFISEQKADIICLQEILYDRGDVQKFITELGQTYRTPNFYYRNYFATDKQKLDGTLILTRFPLINKGFLEHNKKTIGIYCDIVIHSDTIRLYNLHLASIHFNREDYDFISDLPNQQDQEVIKKHSLRVLGRLKTAFMRRGNQADLVRNHIKNSPHPVVLCGDINDTPSSYAYRVLASGLTDAFVESGKGMGVTYAGENFPSFRIDYIFHDQVFESFHFLRKKVPLSDHYPISCSLLFKQHGGE